MHPALHTPPALPSLASEAQLPPLPAWEAPRAALCPKEGMQDALEQGCGGVGLSSTSGNAWSLDTLLRMPPPPDDNSSGRSPSCCPLNFSGE